MIIPPVRLSYKADSREPVFLYAFSGHADLTVINKDIQEASASVCVIKALGEVLFLLQRKRKVCRIQRESL